MLLSIFTTSACILYLFLSFYFILADPICKCYGQCSCMSSTFCLVILIGNSTLHLAMTEKFWMPSAIKLNYELNQLSLSINPPGGSRWIIYV